MINYNIFKKIVDKVAANKWKNKVKEMNKEYKKIYHFKGNLWGTECECDTSYKFKGIELLNRISIFIGELKQCSECGYLNKHKNYQIVSSKYHYTSGMNDSRGYK